MLTAAVSRNRNARARLVITITVAVVFHALMDWTFVWFWLGAYLLTQGLDHWLAGRMQRRRGAPNWRCLIVFATAQFISAAAFGSLAVPLWLEGGQVAVVVATLLCAGALINIVATSRGSRLAFAVLAGPHAGYLVLCPVLLSGEPLGGREAGMMLFGTLMVTGNVVAAWLTTERALRAEREARAEADRRNAEAQAATAAKSAFIAAVSHELRTPLSGVLAAAVELQRAAEDPRQAECAAIVAESGRFMQVLLNDLLDLAKIEAGRMTVERTSFDFGVLVQEIGRFWALEAAQKGVPMRVEVKPGMAEKVAGDPTRLRQILNNLLSNALKFTGPDGVTCSVNAAPRKGGRVAVTLRVRDTGPGVPPKALGHLFTAFEQADASIARTHGGTGLGLAISRELARLMGGDLTAENHPEGGAVFVLTLALDVVEDEEAPVTEPGPSPGAVPGLRVLAVDDHEINRRTLALLLAPLEAEVAFAESGAEALALAAGQAFDLILMDVMMPGMDGRDAVRRLRAAPGPNRLTPVIAVTGGDSRAELQACGAAGMTACVIKPIQADKLYAAISDCLSGAGEPALALSA